MVWWLVLVKNLPGGGSGFSLYHDTHGQGDKAPWQAISHSDNLCVFSRVDLGSNMSPFPTIQESALMADWSKALSLTASCLSPLSGVQIPAGACEKVASDLGFCSGFRQVSSTNYNWLVTT